MPSDSLAPTIGIYYKGLGMGIDANGYGRTTWKESITAKTTSYTVLITDAGTTFTNKGATVTDTFTLPAIALVPTGWWVEFYQSALFSMVITAPANKMIGYDLATWTTLTVGTTSKMGGFRCRITYDGALYMATCFLANIAQVATFS